MGTPLRILADASIPFAVEAFGGVGEVRQLPGDAISPEALADVDVLLVRSVTNVDEALLAGSPVRFVGTATSGADHIDETYLQRAGVAFASAPGSNATSVVEYTLAALLSVAADLGVPLRGQTLGVVGCGWTGGDIAERAEALGMDVLRCDPPLHRRHRGLSPYVPLEVVLAQSDFVSLHTPLTQDDDEPFPTYHMIGPAALTLMKRSAVLINTARGAVVDNWALKEALRSGQLAGAVLDVWEGEPLPDTELVRLSRVATPHVAGYSFDGKVEGTRMLHNALREWLKTEGTQTPPAWDAERALDMLNTKNLRLHALPVQDDLDDLNEVRWLNVVVRQAYNLRRDDTMFRQAILGAPAGQHDYAFRELRRVYPVRRTWGRFTVQTLIPEWLEHVVTEGLRMRVVQ